MGCSYNKGDITENHRLLSLCPLTSAIKAVDRFTVAGPAQFYVRMHPYTCLCAYESTFIRQHM